MLRTQTVVLLAHPLHQATTANLLPEKVGYESQPGKLTAKRARAAKGALAGAGPGLEELLLPS